MRGHRYFALMFFFGFAVLANAQAPKLGKVSKAELQMKVYEKDTSAAAVFLYKGRNSYFDIDNDLWVLVTEVHERIKILNTEGLKWATRSILLQNDTDGSEKIEKIKAATYNLVDGKVRTTKLDNSGIFKNKREDSWTEVSLTLPEAKVGAVVDIKYRLVTPFFYQIDDVVVQEDIPVNQHYTKIQIIEKYLYRRLIQGGFKAQPKDYTAVRRVNYDYNKNVGIAQVNENGTALFDEFISEYQYTDVPALKPEPFTNNIENYRWAIKYELSTIIHDGGKVDDLTKTWEDVVEEVFKHENFGKQLSRRNFFKEDLEQLLAGVENPTEKMQLVYRFVQDRMNWNGDARLLSAAGIAKAYREKAGNSADINLLLIAMLKESGLEAKPVLVSTRENGIPAFPTLNGFNYVVAAVELADGTYFLDATEKLAAPNVLPVRILNWNGRLISKEGSSVEVDLYPKQISRATSILTAALDPAGDLKGKLKTSYTQLEAFEKRKDFAFKSSQLIEEGLMRNYNADLIEQLAIQNLKENAKPLNLSFDFEKEGVVDIIGDEMYVYPMFFLGLYENPFKLGERTYPVDFGHPYSHRNIITIDLPAGYTISSLPEATNISLPGGMGTYNYKVGQANGKLNIMCSFTMKKAIIPAAQYPALKEFFNQRVNKEREQIILIKS